MPRPFGRNGFKSWAIAAAWYRGDLSTFSTFETVKINSATTSKLYIGIDVHKEKSLFRKICG
jgi:hypothetical protein